MFTGNIFHWQIENLFPVILLSLHDQNGILSQMYKTTLI